MARRGRGGAGRGPSGRVERKVGARRLQGAGPAGRPAINAVAFDRLAYSIGKGGRGRPATAAATATAVVGCMEEGIRIRIRGRGAKRRGRNCDGHRTPARPPLAHLMPDVTAE